MTVSSGVEALEEAGAAVSLADAIAWAPSNAPTPKAATMATRPIQWLSLRARIDVSPPVGMQKIDGAVVILP
jgi:hypothetical protein